MTTTIHSDTPRIDDPPYHIDIGCGQSKCDPNAIGIDIREYEPVDIVADIEESIPLPDNSVERVTAISVLEHIDDLPGLMAELYRICRNGAIVEGKAPHWRDANAYTDPTHVPRTVQPDGDPPARGACGFSEDTFDFWDPRTEHGGRDYFEPEFRVIECSRIRRVKFWRSRPIEFTLRVVKQGQPAIDGGTNSWHRIDSTNSNSD